MVPRARGAESLPGGRTDPGPAPSRQALRRRPVGVEPLLAEAQQGHGLRRRRGVANAHRQGRLIATGQKRQRVLAARGGGATPRAAACWPGQPRPSGR
jgi:hypothetical protein